MNRNTVLGLVAIALVAGGGTWWYLSRPLPNNGAQPSENLGTTPTAQAATLEGEFECLPHKTTSGPITLECAFGLKTKEGVHYGLSTGDANPSLLGNITMGQRIFVQGMLVPIEAISSDQWQKNYDIKGIMNVSTVRVLEDEGKG